MNIMDLANCESKESLFNTGIPLCDLKKKKMRGVILTDKGVTFTAAQMATIATFIAALKAGAIAERGSRVYPIWDILNFTDNTGDPTTGGVGNLTTATIVTGDAIPAFSFGYDGSEARHARIAEMANMQLRAIFVDSQFAAYGQKTADGEFAGYDLMQQYVDPSKFIVADAVDQYRFRLTLADFGQYTSGSSYVVTNSGILQAVGLITTEMTLLSMAANVAKVQIVADGGTNMQVLHGAAIVGLAADFTAKNAQTGAAVPVTSVAEDAALDAFTVTIDTAAWAALAVGDSIILYGPLVTDLADAGVKPFEFIPLLITKTA